MRLGLGVSVGLALLAALPGTVRAHPLLDQGIASYEEADFTAALEAFDAASRDAELSVEDLLRLFEMRALVHHGMGDEEAMRSDLHRLVAVRPDYALGALAPPPVQSAFHDLRIEYRAAGLRIEERTENGVPTIVARVAEVPDNLVDHVSLQCTLGANHGKVSRTSKGTEAKVYLAQGIGHEGCVAAARTWQGGVLFRASIDAPQPLPESVTRGFEAPRYEPAADTGANEKKRKKWPWFVAAAGVALVGGVTAAAVASGGSSTQTKSLGRGMVNW